MKFIKRIFFLCCFIVSSFHFISVAHAICGDGVRDADEECDDGNNTNGDGCPANCRPSCGDGNLDSGEQCDDGNNLVGDGCNSICQNEVCGNGIKDPPREECDDGNTNDLDGCSNNCLSRMECHPRGKREACTDYMSQDFDDAGTIIEGACVRWERVCDGDASWGPCNKVDLSLPSQDPSECILFDCDPQQGIVEVYVPAGTNLGVSPDGCTRQECDGSGNIASVDRTPAEGAPASCFCPNGIVGDYPGEECDDGNLINNDACSNTCKKREICDGQDNDGDGLVDEGFPDSDHDGVANCVDICQGGDDRADADQDGLPDFCDPELCNGIDDNGIGGIDEGFPDTDGDGIADCVDTEICDGIDNNGNGQIDEGFPDSDGDGVKDCLDICAGGDDHSDADGDGLPDFCDPELCNGIDDNGIGGVDEGFPDSDGDGVADCVDVETCDGLDNDGDGLIDEGFPDTDGDGTADCVDLEICDGLDNDGDGQIDEGFPDTDQDGIADCRDSEVCDGLDNDGDGQVDEGFPDTDQDGIADCRDQEVCDGLDNDGDRQVDEGFPDTDGDGIANCVDTEICDGLDNDGDGLIDEGFPDRDGDGVKNCVDICRGGDDHADADHDGIPNFCDPEICNGLDDNGVSGADEGFVDVDGDHIGDECDPQICGNGIKEGTEACDDGNSNNLDSCRNNCTLPTPADFCGDGVVSGSEECDGGVGCKANCTFVVCGNAILEAGEECDDGNAFSGDGCSSACVVENTDVPAPPENPDGDGTTEEPPQDTIPAIDNEGDCVSVGGNWTPSVSDVLDGGHAEPDQNEIVYDASDVAGICDIAGVQFLGSGCMANLETPKSLDQLNWGYIMLTLILFIPSLLMRWRLRLDE